MPKRRFLLIALVMALLGGSSFAQTNTIIVDPIDRPLWWRGLSYKPHEVPAFLQCAAHNAHGASNSKDPDATAAFQANIKKFLGAAEKAYGKGRSLPHELINEAENAYAQNLNRVGSDEQRRSALLSEITRHCFDLGVLITVAENEK